MSKSEEANKDYTYFHERLDQLGWTPELNTIVQPLRHSGDGKEHQDPLFDVDAEGNLVINYYLPTGQQASFKRANSNVSKDYQVTRWITPRIKPDGRIEKYKNPAGTGTIPWFPKNVIEAFNASQEVDCVVMLEGQLKAFAGSVHGLYTIGLPGIHNAKDKTTGTLHGSILQVLKVLKPKAVIFRHDGDCRNLSAKWPEEDPLVDLYEKPNGFYTSARNMGELLKDYARMHGFRTYYHRSERGVTSNRRAGEALPPRHWTPRRCLRRSAGSFRE